MGSILTTVVQEKKKTLFEHNFCEKKSKTEMEKKLCTKQPLAWTS